MANSVDTDQKLHVAASDLGLHCFQWPIYPNTSCFYGILNALLTSSLVYNMPKSSWLERLVT